MDKFAEQNKILNDAPHSYYANLISITRNLPESEVLAQLAEEASELAQAALKVRRTLSFVNETPMNYEKAVGNLIEEIADVKVSLDVLMMQDARLKTAQGQDEIMRIKTVKAARWCERLKITMEEYDHEFRTDD